MTSSPPSWSSGDRPRRHVASVDPEQPAEITLSLPVVRCATGNDEDRVWSEVDRGVFARVTLLRAECVCDQCGRCGAWIVFVDVHER